MHAQKFETNFRKELSKSDPFHITRWDPQLAIDRLHLLFDIVDASLDETGAVKEAAHS